MTQGEWLLILSTLTGPVLAVQAQKWVERARENTIRREAVFSALITSRQAKLSAEHVRALNSIDLAFYGLRFIGRPWRRARSQAVLDAWQDYRTHLSPREHERPKTEAEHREFNGRGEELFLNLLERLARATNYSFNRESLRTGSYSPESAWTVEQENHQLRRAMLDVFTATKPMSMAVTEWPVDAAAVERQQAMQAQVVEILGRLAAKQ